VSVAVHAAVLQIGCWALAVLIDVSVLQGKQAREPSLSALQQTVLITACVHRPYCNSRTIIPPVSHCSTCTRVWRPIS
jgi:hypothetical protein